MHHRDALADRRERVYFESKCVSSHLSQLYYSSIKTISSVWNNKKSFCFFHSRECSMQKSTVFVLKKRVTQNMNFYFYFGVIDNRLHSERQMSRCCCCVKRWYTCFCKLLFTSKNCATSGCRGHANSSTKFVIKKFDKIVAKLFTSFRHTHQILSRSYTPRGSLSSNIIR